MKAQILSNNGKAGEVELPKIFLERIREDICQKYFEIEKEIQPYAPYLEAGKQHSASGRISHSRRKWRTAYGKGISRVPRKIFWRRGDHFYWVGAEVSGMRGGRRPHPPKVVHFLTKRRMNKKEARIAIRSAIASTANLEFLRRRYETLRDVKVELPIVIAGDVLKLKAKEFYVFLEKNLTNLMGVTLKSREIRAGRGKSRGRRYKENQGMLLVVGKDENAKFQGIDIRKLDDVEIKDLFPIGRITMYTENALKDLALLDVEKKVVSDKFEEKVVSSKLKGGKK
jgi:large subunit ribosomal protein L4e